ncbi:MAG: ComEC/Rec2 family competence protein [Eubacterium sp.]|nr:ComEC/Rec2 family competence protein [Eubacterium sp.]
MKRVFAHIGFSFAITLIILNFLKIEAAFVILAIASVAFAISILLKITRQSVSVPLCMFSAVLACVIFISNYYFVFLPQKNLDAEKVNAEFYIVDLEENKNDSYYYTVKTSYINKNNSPQSIKLTLKSEDKINADYYQKISGNIKLRLIAENGFSSYGCFGNNEFLAGTLLDFKVQNEKVFNINTFILHQRESIKNFVKSNIKSPENSIIIALLIGDKSEIPSQINDDFKYSGMSHLMAVSGLHLAVFCGAVSLLLKNLRIPKIPQVCISLFSVLLYMGLAGFSKSVLRAGIMMIILLCGRLFNERSDALNALGIAVFLICLNPYAVTDAGALLTVTAVLGLIIINPILRKICNPKFFITDYVFKTICASVSVFITTLPVCCICFGYVSTFGILLNIIMIPIAQIALISSLLMIIFGWCNPFLFVFSRISRVLSSAMILIAEKTAGIPHAVADLSDNKYFLAIGAVFIILGVSFFFNSKKAVKRASVLAIVIFISVISVSDFLNQNNVYVREIHSYYSTSVVVYNKKNAVVIGVNDSSQYYAVSNMLRSKNLHISMIVDTNNSEYSKRLANKFGALNYVCKNENAKFIQNCDNFFCDDEFNIDLWKQLNVEYKSNTKNKYVTLTIFDTEFMCINKYETINADNHSIYLSNPSDYDIVYTVNENGYSERRLNEWQK